TKEEALSTVKRAICNLIQNAKRPNYEAIDSNPLAPIVKAKLLHIYFPNEYAPIYAESHLRHFIAELNVFGRFPTTFSMQRALMSFRTAVVELRQSSPVLFMRVLYNLFGPPESLGSHPQMVNPQSLLHSLRSRFLDVSS